MKPDEIKKQIENFKTNDLTVLSNNYKFPTYKWINLIHLYTNGVEGSYTSLLGDNPNVFVNDFQELTEKIKEQVKLNLIDLKFDIKTEVNPLAKVIVKAANRKFYNEYNDNDESFAETIDFVVEDAVDYGSGIMMLYYDEKGILQNKHIDPTKIIFNQYNFSKGIKVLQSRRTLKTILQDPVYDKDALNKLENSYQDIKEHYEDVLTINKVFVPKDTNNLDKGDNIYVYIFKEDIDSRDLKEDILLHEGETKIRTFWKIDTIKRRGFEDAWGIGAYEKGFSILMGLKKNRERLDKVMEIISTLTFWKKREGTPEGDELIGGNYEGLETGDILGYYDNPIEPMQFGGQEQYNVLISQLASLKADAQTKLWINDALQGNTLPSGTSYALGNQQMEMASSVLKEAQKNYGKWIRMFYRKVIIPHIFKLFNDKDNLKKYINEGDINYIKKKIADGLLIIAEIEHSTNPETFNKPFIKEIEQEKIMRKIKNKGFITNKTLEKLRNSIDDIDLVITGERKSKAQSQAFIQGLLADYKQNPNLFSDEVYKRLQTALAETDTGFDTEEVDVLLKEPEQKQQNIINPQNINQ